MNIVVLKRKEVFLLENSDQNAELTKKSSGNDHDGLTININITYNIGNTENHIEQRAEGGGQINKDVGTNANQGGQNALDHSLAQNNDSNFANGNGRSGIAGDENDEAGGQQGIKVRDSQLERTVILSSSEHSEGGELPDELSDTDELTAGDE